MALPTSSKKTLHDLIPPNNNNNNSSSSNGGAGSGERPQFVTAYANYVESNGLLPNDIHTTSSRTVSTTDENLAALLAGLDLAELDDPIEPYLTCFQQLEQQYPFQTQLLPSLSGDNNNDNNNIHNNNNTNNNKNINTQALDALAFADSTNTPHTYARALRACLDRFGSAAYTYYRNDPRYFNVWLTYLRRCVPLAAHGRTYRYLYEQGIGTSLARFYESYAEWLLRQQQQLNASGQADLAALGRARRVLEIGVQRGARPVQRLEKIYRQVVAQATTRNDDDYHFLKFDNVLPPTPARREHIAVALPHLHDDVQEEDYCLEEVLAKSRDILYKTYHRPAPGDAGFTTTITEEGTVVTAVVATPRRKKPKKSRSLSAANTPNSQHSTGSSNSSSSSNNSRSSIVTSAVPSPVPAVRSPMPSRSATSTPTRQERAASAPAVVIHDAVCDPTSSDHKRAILAARHAVLAGAAHVHHAGTTRLGNHMALRKAFKRANGPGHTHGFLFSLPGSGGRGTPRAASSHNNNNNNIHFMARKFLGEGGFGAVYLAEPLTARGEPTGRQVALKVEDEPNAWEPYILTLLQQRLAGPGLRAQRHALEQHVVQLYGAHLFRDASCLALEYLPQGTVLDAVNAARRDAGTALLDEVVVVFFVVQLLRAVEALHAARVIHGDIKPDNVMLQLDPVDEEGGEVWDRYYRAPSYSGGGGGSSSSSGWARKRLKLIDFGRAIDLSAYRPGVEFSAAEWAGSMDQQDCAEMREGSTWTYQADYHGVAGVVHCLLFGRFIQTTARKGPGGATVYGISAPYKRYWQQHMWADLFYTLLNSAAVAQTPAAAAASNRGARADGGGMPITHELARLRGTLERWLEANCEAGTNSLKTAVRKLELALTAAAQSSHARKK